MERPVRGIQSLEIVAEEKEEGQNLIQKERKTTPEDWTVKAIGNLAKNRQKKYVEVSFGEQSLGRCLLDTGSEVNVLPKALADKIRLPRSRSPIPSLEGFNGSLAKVDGVWYGELRTKEGLPAIKTSFLIADLATCPIIGMQTLHLLGIKWDFGENRVMLPKNEGELNNLSLHKTKNG